MDWITANPEIFISVLIGLLIVVIVVRNVFSRTETDDREIEEVTPPQLSDVPVSDDPLPQDRSQDKVAVRLDAEERAPDTPPAHPKEQEKFIEEEAPTTPPARKNLFIAGLQRSRAALMNGLSVLWSGEPINEEALEELEDTLIAADLGVHTATEIIDELRQCATTGADESEFRALLRETLLKRIGPTKELATVEDGPLVILVVGVNGSGKTTTIGKLAHRYIQSGKRVMVAAGDTFRAGAIEQLKVWAERSGAEFISSQPKADPASVIYTALESAKAKNIDVVICDTAGRLQVQSALMEELSKVVRVGKKVIAAAPHETLLVLDATIGQNALSQAEGFNEAAELTGVVLTKLDGTAKGGVVLAVQKKIGIPVKLVGLGESINDLHDFIPENFVDALLFKDEVLGD